MTFRVATLNLEQDHKRWAQRRHLMARCIDDIWIGGPLRVLASGVCFDQPSSHDPTLWPSDHMGVWADLAWE